MPKFPRDPEAQRDLMSHGLIRSHLRRTPPIFNAGWQGELQGELYQQFRTPLAFTPLDFWLSQGEIIALVRSEKPLLTRLGKWRLVDSHLPHRSRFLNLLGRPLRAREEKPVARPRLNVPELHRLLRRVDQTGSTSSDWEYALEQHLPASTTWHGHPDLQAALCEHLKTYDLLNSPAVQVSTLTLSALLKQGPCLHLLCEVQVDTTSAPLTELADAIHDAPNAQAMRADGWQLQSSPLAQRPDHISVLLSSPPAFEQFFDQVESPNTLREHAAVPGGSL